MMNAGRCVHASRSLERRWRAMEAEAGQDSDGLPLSLLWPFLGLEDVLSVSQVSRGCRQAVDSLLTRLDLRSVPTEATKWLGWLISNPHRLKLLKSLKLEFCDDVADDHVQKLRELPALTCLHVTDAGVLQVLPGCPSLTHLELYWNLNVTDNLLFGISAYASEIQTLNLSGCKAVTDDGIRILAASCPRLEHLDLTRCVRLTDGALKAIGQGCAELKSLNLYAVASFTSKGVEALSAGCTQLEFLDVCGSSQISDDGMVTLATCCPLVKHLNLTWCVNLTDTAVIAIAKGCPQLEMLSLHGNLNVTDACITALSEGVASTLTTLDVNGCTGITTLRTPEALYRLLPRLHCLLVHK